MSLSCLVSSYHVIVQVPYENYRKVFRTSQKNIEKELGAVQTAANDIAERAKSGSSDTDDDINAVEGMIARVENLKRKVWILTSQSIRSQLTETA